MKFLNFIINGLLLGSVCAIQPANTSWSVATAADFDFKNFDFWANQCLQLSDNQNYTEALTSCERAIALQPKRANAQLWLARSQALLQTGKYAEAIASYDQVLKVSPKSSFAIFSQCSALLQLERYEDALDACDRALQLDGDWGKASASLAWTYRGLVLRRLGYLETALASFNRALMTEPDNSFAKAEQCTIQLDFQTKPSEGQSTCEKLDKAVEHFEQALVSSPTNAQIWLEQGLVLEQLGQDERALTSYQRAVQLSQNQPLPMARQCAALNYLENYKDALETCNQALQKMNQGTPWQFAFLWTQHSIASLGLGKLDEAIASADRALSIQSDYADAFNSKALALWKRSDYENAEAAIQKAINAYQNIQTAFQDKFYRKYPESKAAVRRGQMVAYFNKGRILSSQRRYKDALDAYEVAKNILKIKTQIQEFSSQASPRDRRLAANLYANQSAVFINMGNYQAALKQAEDSLKLNPKKVFVKKDKDQQDGEWQPCNEDYVFSN